MKINRENIKMFIKLYWPDALILIGIFILSYNFFQFTIGGDFLFPSRTIVEWWKILGLILIVIGTDIAIRKMFKK